MPRPARSPEFLHLTRFDGPTAQGWQVRMPPWFLVTGYTQFFPDKVYGDANAALASARKLRDKLFKAANLEMRLKGHTTSKKSTSGLVGVSLVFAEGRTGAHAYSWKAQWTEDGIPKRRNFSVGKYGFDGALTRAVQVREEKTNLKFTAEHLEQAQQLKAEVEAYVRSGDRPSRDTVCAPERTSPRLPG